MSFALMQVIRQLSGKTDQKESPKKQHRLEINKRRCGVPSEAMPINYQVA